MYRDAIVVMAAEDGWRVLTWDDPYPKFFAMPDWQAVVGFALARWRCAAGD